MLAQLPKARVAVLYQQIDPPVINGVQKPRKPGGYTDSGADIAFALRTSDLVDVVTPHPSPDPSVDRGWAFPDTEDGIMAAVEQGANVLWANTIVFASHPLQVSERLTAYEHEIRVVGQPPSLVEQYDDKNYVNDLLRNHSTYKFTMPRCWIADARQQDAHGFVSSHDLPYPIVCKPIRGRGSHGVRLCDTPELLVNHMDYLFTESPAVMIEEFLAGEEGTVTVMPPSADHQGGYWALPIVMRFNHEDGVAPYNGLVPVAHNSKVQPRSDVEGNTTFAEVSRQCEEVAKLLKATSPIRIDVRRFKDDPRSPFALFDINMKPNMTGPGRPGRDDQASLSAIAAAGLGWSYPQLLTEILQTAVPLQKLRAMKLAK